MARPQVQIGVIGGSGLYDMPGLTEVEEVQVSTPFGNPSDAIIVGRLGGRWVAFLPRHGRGHRISPSQLPARANLYALKSLGVQRVIAVSAVGSLKAEVRPLDMVIPDQLIDRTRGRSSTFFAEGLVVHVGFAQPFCPQLSDLLYEEARRHRVQIHRGGTYVVIEGPQFSTLAESNLYRSWGASVIGMTALPEAKLAREAEICYAILANSTDYDCWHPAHDTVTAEMILSNLSKNADNARDVVKAAILRMPLEESCACQQALKHAMVTAPSQIPESVKETLAPIIGKYLAKR